MNDATNKADSTNNALLVVGLGGLGVPAAAALVHAGAEHLILVDPDVVELSNLSRQVIFLNSDIGTPKVLAAAKRLGAIRPQVRFELHPAELGASNAARLIEESAFVIDATDNPVTKFLINDVCLAVGRPFVYAGVLGMTGQAMSVLPGRSACLRCIFEQPPDEQEVASCRDGGIVGPVAGAIGEAQAAEALRYLRNQQPALAGMMLRYDAAGAGRIRLTPIAARAGCVCGASRMATAVSHG